MEPITVILWGRLEFVPRYFLPTGEVGTRLVCVCQGRSMRTCVSFNALVQLLRSHMFLFTHDPVDSFDCAAEAVCISIVQVRPCSGFMFRLCGKVSSASMWHTR